MRSLTYRLATDIGGTFTDSVLLNEDTGEVFFDKRPTTSKDFAVGATESAESYRIPLAGVMSVIHGSTVAINTVIERKGAKTAMITTKGFRDIIEVRRSNRTEMYNPLWKAERPFIDRYLRLEISERMLYDGTVMRPVVAEEVDAVCKTLDGLGIKSVCIALLNSYVNSDHEREVERFVKEASPEAFVTLSSSFLREYREYERFSTAVINSYIGPTVRSYLRHLHGSLVERGFKGDLQIMQSNGGIMTLETASVQPVRMMESGPAAGVAGSAAVGSILGYENIVTFDMGGTTAKSGIIDRAIPRVTTDYKLSGYPIRINFLDIEEIGAGGGSVGWSDSAGALHVGPKSTGAEPGPACYGLGGTQPTVTDANLLLGRLNQKHLLGGKMKIYPDLARDAVARLADAHHLDVIEAANGMMKIVNNNMSGLLQVMTTRRGYDPRDLTLFAYGGGGPLHVFELAKELGIKRIVIPSYPGNFSAWGMLVTDLRHDFFLPFIHKLSQVDLDRLNGVLRSLEEEAVNTLKNEGFRGDVQMIRSLELRYFGQEHNLTIPLPSGELTEEDLGRIATAFDSLHESTYLHSSPGEQKEIYAAKVTVIGVVQKPKLPRATEGTAAPPADSIIERRDVFFEESGFVDCTVYDRRRLRANNRAEGPAIIEEETSTIVLHPGQSATIDGYGLIEMEQ